MLSVICWKWKPQNGYRSAFGPETVNVLRSMVRRNYQKPHRFICVTDDAKGIESDIEIVPLWDDHASVPAPNGDGNPNCYRRLKSFSKEAVAFFGERLVSLDLDCVIIGDVAPLWDRTEDFVIWGDTSPGTPYNGSMFLLRTGSRCAVWDDFNPKTSPAQGRRLGYFGSDQAWIAARLGTQQPTWSQRDGIYSYRCHIKPNGNHLPPDARIVMFHGRVDPWSQEAQRLSWVKEHYQ